LTSITMVVMAEGKGIPTSEQEKEPDKRPPWWKRLWGWTKFGEKSGWEYLQLLSAFAIPVVLAVAGLWFTMQQDVRQRELEEQRAQEAALQAYLDQMNLLMLESNLRNSDVGSEARTLARSRTLTVLGRLDSSRKSQILRFLIEAELVQRVAGTEPVFSLSDANLQGVEVPPTFTADLSGADLSNANLSGADLSNANLPASNLSNANLRDAKLPESNLSDANLSSADLAHADLRDSDLSDANLRGGDLSEADLIDANLRGATLQQAILKKSDLSEANLGSADLAYANLSSADLSDCYLGLADLSGTNLSQDQRRECSTNAEPKDATIYIEARGGIFGAVAGGVGQVVYGQGSGFIIDEDGMAITANHVVTGASPLNVYVAGEEDPLPAAVLGVSECFDLALIDIAGGGYPDIEWGSGEIENGVEVTALGYPAEDITAGEQPEQTVRKGNINVIEASDATYSASVKSVNGRKAVIKAKHEAPLRLGMSGGPLVTEEGEAVGINLSTGETEQSWAISRDVAKPIIEDLSPGSDVASIGVNGEAHTDSGGGPAGILVASVDPGSPADEVGVQKIDVSEGATELMRVDFITKLGERKLTKDETMKTYCDTLLTPTADKPLDIEVERWIFDEIGEPIGLALYEGVLPGEPLQKNEAKTKERLSQLSRQGVLPKNCTDANDNGICDSGETMRGAKATPQTTASTASPSAPASAPATPTPSPEAPPTNQGAASVTPSPAPPSEP
jgi:uncharacterized protein YjbI with pentapeptide repeats